MDKNQIIGISLIALIVVGFSILNRPSDEEIARQQAVRDSIAAVESIQVDSTAIENGTSTLSAENDTLEVEEPSKNEEFFNLQNEKLKVKISNHGGKVAYLQLKEYQRHDSTDLILVESGSNHFGFGVTGGINTDNVLVF